MELGQHIPRNKQHAFYGGYAGPAPYGVCPDGPVSYTHLVFDLATAFETVYFWPGPTESFREVYRTLRPGGVFLIVNEVDGENPRDSRWLSVIDGMKIFNRSQFVTFLTEAGFSKVIVKRDAKRHWLCVLAIRDDAGYLGNT